MKTYGVELYGRERYIVTTTSKAQAAKLIGTTVYNMTQFGSVTGNEEECRITTDRPGVVYKRSILDSRAPWVQVSA